MTGATASQSLLLVGDGWFPAKPGGLDRYVFELSRALSDGLADTVELCGVGAPDGGWSGPFAVTNLAPAGLPGWQRPRRIRQGFARRAVAAPDAVNLHFAYTSWPLLGMLPDEAPVTFTFHGPWALEGAEERGGGGAVAAKRWIERRVHRRSDRFIVLSDAFGDILQRDYGVAPARIHRVPGGVDTARFVDDVDRAAARRALGWPTDRMVLFTPRRLVRRMGLEHLLDAVARVRGHVDDVWLAIAGRGPLREALEARVAGLGLSEHVRFLGYLPDADLPTAYQAADLTVVPSQALEGFGLVLLESLASGTPVLATPVGGMPEVLTPFCADLVTDSPRTEDIADALTAVAGGDSPLPDRAACRAYAAARFDWSTVARDVRAVLTGGR